MKKKAIPIVINEETFESAIDKPIRLWITTNPAGARDSDLDKLKRKKWGEAQYIATGECSLGFGHDASLCLFLSSTKSGKFWALKDSYHHRKTVAVAEVIDLDQLDQMPLEKIAAMMLAQLYLDGGDFLETADDYGEIDGELLMDLLYYYIEKNGRGEIISSNVEADRKKYPEINAELCGLSQLEYEILLKQTKNQQFKLKVYTFFSDNTSSEFKRIKNLPWGKWKFLYGGDWCEGGMVQDTTRLFFATTSDTKYFAISLKENSEKIIVAGYIPDGFEAAVESISAFLLGKLQLGYGEYIENVIDWGDINIMLLLDLKKHFYDRFLEVRRKARESSKES